MTAPDFDKLFGPELILEKEDLEEPDIRCGQCPNAAKYILDKIMMQLRTSEGARHIVESSSPAIIIAACNEHKTEDLEDYIAGGVHLGIMNQTGVRSEIDSYTFYWREV